MAKLDPKPYPGFEKPWDNDPDYFKRPVSSSTPEERDAARARSDAHWKAEEVKLTELMERSDKLLDGEIRWALLSFPWADGYAHYVVTKDRPLTLTHVPYGDGWAVPDALIRGLRRADVLREIELLILGFPDRARSQAPVRIPPRSRRAITRRLP